MGKNQMLKLLVVAPDPEYPDDGYEVEEIRYLDGHEDEPRVCTCGADVAERSGADDEVEIQPVWPTHAFECPARLKTGTLTDAEWAYECIRNDSGPNGCADYLWGNLAPPAGPRFWVIGYCWAAQDYWGEWDGGFEFQGFEKWRMPT